MKTFIKYFFIAGGFAFIAMFCLSYIVHVIWPPYSIESVIGGSVGCGIGTGLVNGLFAAYLEAA